MDRSASNESEGTRVGRVMGAIRDRIARRSLTPGSRLPSIRAFAETMQVSKSTVVEAYDRLAAEGTIRSRPGSGFYVAAPLAPLALAEIGPRLDQAVDPFWVSRQSLEAGTDLLKPGCGWLPAEWMPVESLRRALRGIVRAAEPATLTDYGSPRGLPALRQLLARRMAERGIETAPDQILITESCTQALDLLCRFLIEPGDSVLVDDPCYFNFLALLRAHRARVVGVPLTPTGPDLRLFAQALSEHRPRLYITNSGLQNPTGASLQPSVAHRLLKLAAEHELIVIEDDIFADFEHEPAPRLAELDGLERVIRIASCSKTLSASVRCGYIAGPRDWIDNLVDLRIATDFSSRRLSAELVLTALTDGSYRKHMEALRARLSKAMAATNRRLKGLGIEPWLEPVAGMFLWCRLPDGLDAGEVARRALAEKLVLAPGNAFSPSQTAPHFMRFNVAQCGDERVFKVLERAMRG